MTMTAHHSWRDHDARLVCAVFVRSAVAVANVPTLCAKAKRTRVANIRSLWPSRPPRGDL